MKKLVAFSMLAASLSMALPALAQTAATGTANTTTITPPQAPTSTVSTGPNVSCVAGAVFTRESALTTGITTYTQTVNSSYSVRGAALQAAYSSTKTSDIKTAVNAAWKNFNTSMKNAQKVWKTSRDNAWAKFKVAVKSCKGGTTISDSVNSASEASGQ